MKRLRSNLVIHRFSQVTVSLRSKSFSVNFLLRRSVGSLLRSRYGPLLIRVFILWRKVSVSYKTTLAWPLSAGRTMSVILLQAFEGLFHAFSDVRPRWLCLLEKIICSSPDWRGLFCVKWFYNRLDFGNYLNSHMSNPSLRPTNNVWRVYPEFFPRFNFI